MKRYSINHKLNKCLNGIEDSLLSILDTEAESLQEVRRYVSEFKKEPDYNIAQYGNLICYYPEVRDFYRSCGYKNTEKMSNEKLWATYLHQVGYVARQLVK